MVLTTDRGHTQGTFFFHTTKSYFEIRQNRKVPNIRWKVVLIDLEIHRKLADKLPNSSLQTEAKDKFPN